MPKAQIEISTKDGVCPATVFTPSGEGSWPAVLYIVDGLGIRPTVLDMGQRLSDAGYVVLLPDIFYRRGQYGPLDPMEIFAQPDVRAILRPMTTAIDNGKAADDAAAFIAYLDSRTDVRGAKFGVVGYCMGGGIALTIAGVYPDRIAAAASFHGGSLATDSSLSPHLLAHQITARIYIGVADKDGSYPPEMAARLEAALRESGVEFVSAFYPGASHGWTQTDFPVYHREAAERHWRDLLDLFKDRLP